MRAAYILILFISMPAWAYSQHVFLAIVKDKKTLEPLPGASAIVQNTAQGARADETGTLRIENIPAGQQTILISFVGYESQTYTLNFPLPSVIPVEIFLEPSGEELEEVIISTTRSSRTIADVPTRVEFIAGEELEEKGNMKPGDIRMLLSESTGIQTQQTSATSANASIRIQGLDGRYTQILKDGFPLYAGFSGGLGLLQTPPLDLKQVEVIKGSSSTLYGGGAIAGLVNLISKRPTDERQVKLWINGTSAKGLDANIFYGEKYGKAGLTLFLAKNSNEAYDPANIDLSAIPKFDRYTVNPKLFLEINDKNKIELGLNISTENRTGGDIHYINGNGNATHRYFERNNSNRLSTQFSFQHDFSKTKRLNVKNSVSYFKRDIRMPDYAFDGKQMNTFAEINYGSTHEKSEWIVGVNFWSDNFSEDQLTVIPLRNYNQQTLGGFLQHTQKVTEKINLESGIRGDYVMEYGFVLLPRISLLYKSSTRFSSRLGGGFGYKAPTIFTEESERIQYQNVLPVSPEENKLEKSYGANWDFNHRTSFANGAVGISINHLFFYTHLSNPLVLTAASTDEYQFVNLSGFTGSAGTETNAKIDFAHFKLFVGYTFTDTKIHANGTVSQNPLTAKHRLNNVLMYEVPEKWKIGLEAYYFSPQKLNDGATGKRYWICGFMVEKIWEHVSVYINFENFLDARQTRFDSIYTGTVSYPVFRDIYAPVDGFVVNGGIKVWF